MLRLKDKYKNKIIPALTKEFGYRNPMQVTKLRKVVVNRGLGEATLNPKVLEVAVEELTQITGQRPLITRSKKAIAAFKLKAKTPIGCKVTLRGERMYEFIDKLVNICLPRIRDFKGVSPKSFDGRGNYALGIKEQLIFPEIVYEKVDKLRGMDIIIETTAHTDEEAKALLKYLGFPFRKEKLESG